MLEKHFFIRTDSVTSRNNIVEFKDYRISLLKDRLIRIEKNKDNNFLDLPTSAVLYRNFEEVVRRFHNKEITNVNAAKLLNMTREIFLKYSKSLISNL